MRHTLTLMVLLAVLSPALAAWGQNDVDVTCKYFGVGNAYRPGEHTGIMLVLTASGLSEATNLWVQVEIPNPDGDAVEYGRKVALSPGARRELWVNAKLPWEFGNRTVLTVRVFEEDDGRRGREIGGGRISPQAAVAGQIDITKSKILVVGQTGSNMRLIDYSAPPGLTQGRARFFNEDTRVVGIRAEDLPDRWEALLGFEAICWGGDVTVSTCTTDQVQALKDYIYRGGHLCIVLPDTGNPWGLGTTPSSALDELLPPAPVAKPDVSLEKVVRPVISKAETIGDRDRNLTVQVFGDVTTFAPDPDDQTRPIHGRIGNHYEPLLALEDGRVFCVQRTYGHGRLTVVGINLASGQLISQREAFQADMVWNPILGRRCDTPSGTELAGISNADRLSRKSATESNLGGGRLFDQLISMSETAGKGLGIAFFLFLVYWIVAGPGSFFVLKHYRLEKHAWVAFAAAAGLFTAAAWGIVALVKPSEPKIKHVTFLDSIARPGGDRGAQDPQLTRAVSWMSLNLPGYRRTPVFIESEPGQRDLLSSWGSAETQPFPNPDRMRVDVGNRPAALDTYERIHERDSDFRRPSRATATQLYAHWIGALDPSWGGMIRSSPNDPLRVEMVGNNEVLRGSIQHSLPGDLRNATLIWIKSQRTTSRTYAFVSINGERIETPWVPTTTSGRQTNLGGMIRRSGQNDWLPGSPWQLDAEPALVSSRIVREIDARYVDPFVGQGGLQSAISGGAVSQTNLDMFLEAFGFFQQLTPPTYLTTPGNPGDDTAVFYRTLGRELDLSPWFGSPCVIVIGHLHGADLPIPVRVGDERPSSTTDSRIVVRWVHPLELRAEPAFPSAFDGEDAAAGDDDTDETGDGR